MFASLSPVIYAERPAEPETTRDQIKPIQSQVDALFLKVFRVISSTTELVVTPPSSGDCSSSFPGLLASWDRCFTPRHVCILSQIGAHCDGSLNSSGNSRKWKRIKEHKRIMVKPLLKSRLAWWASHSVPMPEKTASNHCPVSLPVGCEH